MERRPDDTPEVDALKQELKMIEDSRRPHIEGPYPHPGGAIRNAAEQAAREKEEERRLKIIAQLEAHEKEKGNFNNGNER